MRQFDYEPKAKDNDGNLLFEGSITIKKPGWEERSKSIKGLEAAKDGAESQGYMIRIAKDGILAFNLKIPSIDETITSFDEMLDYQEGLLLAIEVSKMLMSGIALGNGLKQLSKDK